MVEDLGKAKVETRDKIADRFGIGGSSKPKQRRGRK